jgi:hypothetical protein
MATTTFSGPLKVGTVREGAGTNTGGVVLSQTATFTFADTGSFVTSIIIPAGSQIIDQMVDVTDPFDSVTSDAATIGKDGALDAFGTVASLQAGGRTLVDPSAAQALAISDVGPADIPVYVEITSVGGGLTAGAARLTITYRQV